MMRKFSFLLLSLIIIAIFFAGFFLYYVPSNKDTQNKYAFLVLQNIESNLESKITANTGLYKNRLSKTFVNGRLNDKKLQDEIPNLNKLGVSLVSKGELKKAENHAPVKNHLGKKHADSVTVQLQDISYDSMLYEVRGMADTLVLQNSLHSVFDGILQTHIKDFYDFFLFLKIEDDRAIPVFQSAGLNLGTDISVDSLLPGSRKGFYQGITNVPSEGIAYKMFYIPVNLNGKHFIICGYKDAREYENSLHQVSSGFIYPIVIILFLLLIIMPLIKLSIMGAEERIRIWDFTGYFFSLFLGSMFITLTIIQVVLLKDSEIRLHTNLQNVSSQISNSFSKEITRAYRLLSAVDTVPESTKGFNKEKSWLKDSMLVISGELFDWLKARKDKESLYYNWDRISWSDTTGQQIFKGQIDFQSPVSTDISERKYFRRFRTHNEFRMPGTDSVFYSMEPLFNWVDGSYRMIIAKPSICAHAYIVQLSTLMYTFSQSILPPGYGYCMIGEDGEVQVHSDSSHNLNENFFDELEDDRALRGTMNARQELFIPETKFYGKKNALLIRPVSGLPYYMVVFYDNGSIIPINMRILIFSLLFCLITFVICWLLWMALFWRRFSSKPLLFSYMYYLHWIIPRKKYIQIYFVCFLYLSVYIVALSLASFITDKYAPQNNHIILILLLQTPVNVTCGLYIICRSMKLYQRPENNNKKIYDRRSLYAAVAMLILFISCISLYQRMDVDVFMQFLIFELVLLFFLGYVLLNAEKLLNMKVSTKEKHLTYHTLLVEAVVVCLAVLPAGLFTWYAHNQEILQAVKKDQLCLAHSIEKRDNGIYGELHAIGPDIIPRKVSDTLLYGRGIYAVSQQLVAPDTGTIQPAKADSGFEKFYFAISDQISNDYYSEGFLPALKDTSWDISWEWQRPDTGWLPFLFTMRTGRPHLLNVRSEIPSRFIFLTDWPKLAGLFAFVCVLLIGLFFLIYRSSEGIFLNKFADYARRRHASAGPPFFNKYYAGYGDKQLGPEALRQDLEGAVFEYTPSYDELQMNQYELETVSKLEHYKDYYEFVMDNCSGAQKYMLYSFALNGFLNYKNVTEIYKLLDEGVLKEEDGEVRMFSIGFRAYILKYYAAEGEKVIAKSAGNRTAWQSFKTPFLFLLVAVAAFIFFTRQEAWQRFSALITGLSTSIPLLIGLFRNSFSKKQDV
jgi:hypothetical protein